MPRIPGKVKAGGTGQPTKDGRDAERTDFPGYFARDDIPEKGYDNDLATVKAVRDNDGGGGAVTSVNGKTGDVVLDAADVGALATVATDATLTGDGTAGDPLSVAGGGGGSLTVSDGTTTVANVTQIDFTKASSVTDQGGGTVEVNNDGSGGGGGGSGSYANAYLAADFTPANNSAIPMTADASAGTAVSYNATTTRWEIAEEGGYAVRFFSGVSTSATFNNPILFLDQYASDGTTLKKRHAMTRPEGSNFEVKGDTQTIDCGVGDQLELRYFRAGTSAGVMRGRSSGTDWTWGACEKIEGSSSSGGGGIETIIHEVLVPSSTISIDLGTWTRARITYEAETAGTGTVSFIWNNDTGLTGYNAQATVTSGSVINSAFTPSSARIHSYVIGCSVMGDILIGTRQAIFNCDEFNTVGYTITTTRRGAIIRDVPIAAIGVVKFITENPGDLLFVAGTRIICQRID